MVIREEFLLATSTLNLSFRRPNEHIQGIGQLSQVDEKPSTSIQSQMQWVHKTDNGTVISQQIMGQLPPRENGIP